MTTQLLFAVLAVALVLIGFGVRLRHPSISLVGFGLAACVAFGHLAGRFGLEQIWFRAPTFYIAGTLILIGVIWWLRRPLPLALRLGPLAGTFAAAAALLAFMLFNGRGAPPAMLMPTLDRAAPDFTYVDASGRSRRLSELKGEV